MIWYNIGSMTNLIEYIFKTYGIEIVLKEFSNKDLSSLPFFLKETYNYRTGSLFDKPLVFIEKKVPGIFTPEQYKKHIETIEKVLMKTTIIILPNIETYNRNRLIQKRVSFIIPGKQSFIPNLYIDLKDYLRSEQQPRSHLQPASQVLLLYHLQISSLQRFNYKQLSQILNYSYLTIARAIENLLSLALCKVTNTKEKELIFEINKKELWEKALPVLTSPVKKAVFVNDLIPDQYLFKSNISAMSYYTDISNNSKSYFAIYHNDFKELYKSGVIKMFSEYDGTNYIELWKYNPKILTKDSFVDPLSLFLIFKNSNDQRIEIELEKLISKILW
jgi:hypothetical protein